MNLFAINLLIAGGWVAVSGSFSGVNLLLGYIGGFCALYATRNLFGPTQYFRRTFAMIGLIFYFLYDLTRSSFAVVWDIITPKTYARPAMLKMPLDATEDLEIMLTGNLISLTPGTLTVDVDPERKYLLIHAMFADDPEETIRDLKRGMERRVLEALR
ncbi:MAG: sodium:proton antiporter [Geminicoccaceae bacterium]|nr:MAG: sodium:proton antiporter [Geminicoccaceae bacterium]